MKKLILTALASIAMASAANAVVADRLWIIGEPAGKWDPTVGVELTKVADGVFEYKAEFTAEKTSFGFVNQLAGPDDWDGLKAHRYVAPASGTVPVVGENEMQYANSDYCWDLPAGTYNLTIDTNTMKLILEGDEPVVKPATLYFLGDVNNWTPSAEYAFETEDGVIYTYSATVIRSAEDCQFKIATDGWATEYSNGLQNMEANKIYPIGPGSGVDNMGFADDIEDVVLTLDTKEMTLTVTDHAGVANISTESNLPVEYYNLQGVRTENPVGLVIRKQGANVTKVLVK